MQSRLRSFVSRRRSFYVALMPSDSVAIVIALRCVYTEYDEIFRTYSDVSYETVRGYDVKPRHYQRHSRIQSLGALQNNR